MYHGQPRILEG